MNGRVAVVTGASRGLGRHVALELASAGMQLVLTARSGMELEEVAAACRREQPDPAQPDPAQPGASRPDPVRVQPADIRDAGAIEEVMQSAVRAFGRLDVLINNAGLSWIKPLSEWSRDEIDTVLDVNLKGAIHAARAAADIMIGQKSGHIVNVASDVGRRAIPDMAPYVAAKHGLVGFSGSHLRELRPHGVRVTLLLPGIIDTYFAGAEEGDRDPAWSMDAREVARVIRHALEQPPRMVLDEIQLHPAGQEY
ncbi:MAG: hypothetical protein COV99_08450 [Bacteroidetes bacterium CG12_big_fil_rev_8_21_14_0_65_60_17]|nr:MAG: hypothetical protein COV99_08450 [Bacteroidetes bacterium CG12_big_fil_rev_8_21_14_0_65_60_17]